MTKKTLLFLSWRDIKSSKKGGAEIFTHELLKRLDKKIYNIIHISPMEKDLSEEEWIDGVLYLRKGNLLTVINAARKYYKKNRSGIDYVVEQCNTHRFFTPLWVEANKRIFFIHQLTREIWFYHAKFPLSIVGNLMETFLLKLNRKDIAFTVSNSTKDELVEVGYDSNKTYILPEGLDFKPIDYDETRKDLSDPLFVYVGRYAKYKGIDDSIKAFANVKIVKERAKLKIIGKPNLEYIKNVLTPLCKELRLSESFGDGTGDVDYTGFISETEKKSLMKKAVMLICPSIREGWGLIISEAAALGTPSVVYDAPGTRDAVNLGNAGFMVKKNDIDAISRTIIDMFNNQEKYEEIRRNSYDFVFNMNWANTALSFDNYMKSIDMEVTYENK